MARKIRDDPKNYPWLGRVFLWVDKPGSASKIIWILSAVCLLLFISDFFLERHGYFAFEDVPGFYAIFGFVMFSGVILGAKALRVLIRRSEDYYAPKAIDTEKYPSDQLDKVSHDAD